MKTLSNLMYIEINIICLITNLFTIICHLKVLLTKKVNVSSSFSKFSMTHYSLFRKIIVLRWISRISITAVFHSDKIYKFQIGFIMNMDIRVILFSLTKKKIYTTMILRRNFLLLIHKCIACPSSCTLTYPLCKKYFM